MRIRSGRPSGRDETPEGRAGDNLLTGGAPEKIRTPNPQIRSPLLTDVAKPILARWVCENPCGAETILRPAYVRHTYGLLRPDGKYG